MANRPHDQITAAELRENERALYDTSLSADRKYGTADDYEWWTRGLLPYSAIRVHVLGACPRTGEVTVVVRLRNHTSEHGWLFSRCWRAGCASALRSTTWSTCT